MLKKLLFIFCLSVMAADSLAGGLRFMTQDTSDGLPDNTVKCIGQDKYGFLWLGTFNGLCRYDGRAFTVFRSGTGSGTVLSANEITSLACTPEGVWTGTSKGLDFYSFADSRFHACTLDGQRVMKIKTVLSVGDDVAVIGQDGKLYVKNDGLSFRLFPGREQWHAIAHFRGHLYWGYAASGLYLVDLSTAKIRPLLRCNVKGPAETIYYSHNRRLLYVGGGLDGETAVFRIDGLRAQRADVYAPQRIKAVTDYGRATFFATDGGGLVRLLDGRYTAFLPSNSALGSDAVFSLFVDRQGNLLAGTYRGGLSLYAPRRDCFRTLTMAGGNLSQNLVTAVYVRGDDLFAGLDGGGLNIYNLRTRRTRMLTMADSPLPGNNLLSISGDRDGLWLGFYKDGLCRYVPDGRFRTFPLPPGENHLWCICDDGQGSVWVGGSNLYRFDKCACTYAEIKPLHGAGITCLVQDGGTIWAATSDKGIFRLDAEGRILCHMAAGHASTGSRGFSFLFLDSRHRLWAATDNGGMYRASAGVVRTQWTHLTGDVFSHRIVSMQEERPGVYWLGTYDGLFRYDEHTGAYVRFTKEDGLPATQFNYNASFTAVDGTMYWGTTGGLVYFNPSRIPSSTTFLPVSFTSLQLTDSANTVLDLYGGNRREVRLPYDRNFFTIRFAVPDIAGAGKIRYACLLEHVDKDWRYVDNPQAGYTALPPGEYDFCVRATNADGLWNPRVYTLHIVITPPWWRTWWAMTLWTLLVLAAGYAALRLWTRDRKMKHDLQIQRIKRDADERINRSKMDFLVNIVHELRTPIFLITAPLEELAASGKRLVRMPLSQLQAVCGNALRLHKLIDRISDFRKIESGALSLQLKQFDAVAYCRELSVNYAALCRQKRQTFTFSSDRPFIRLAADPSKLDSILSNLVSNAFKYTGEGGCVSLTITEAEGNAVFSVKDNGIGIAPADQKSVFDNFYQVNASGSPIPGDGIGLSFVKRLVELHHGTVRLESREGEGAEFVFTIPLDLQVPAHPAGELSETENPPSIPAESPSASRPETSSGLSGAAEAGRMDSPAAIHSVLIVDEDSATIDMIEDYLKDDFKVLRASTGAEGFRMACEHPVDIIIADLMMPRPEDTVFLKSIRSDWRTAQVPVIVLTGDTSEENKIKLFREGGVEAFLAKPVSLRYLRERIDYALAQAGRRLADETGTGRRKTYNKEERRFLLQCREVIDTHLSDSRFNVCMMAEGLGMSQSALYRRIKELTGMSIIGFITDYRLFKAVQYFREGETNVGIVCAACGFNDSKNFREAFKRKMKMTPREFIRRLS